MEGKEENYNSVFMKNQDSIRELPVLKSPINLVGRSQPMYSKDQKMVILITMLFTYTCICKRDQVQ